MERGDFGGFANPLTRDAPLDPQRLPIRVRRMLRASERWLADSELHARDVTKVSRADYLLDLLSFEILLRAAYLVHVGGRPRAQNHLRLFQALPDSIQFELYRLARRRTGPGPDYSDVRYLLSCFSRNFVALRQDYDLLGDLIDDESARREREWIESGAPLEPADDVAYHPVELLGLTGALREHLREWLSRHD